MGLQARAVSLGTCTTVPSHAAACEYRQAPRGGKGRFRVTQWHWHCPARVGPARQRTKRQWLHFNRVMFRHGVPQAKFRPYRDVALEPCPKT